MCSNRVNETLHPTLVIRASFLVEISGYSFFTAYKNRECCIDLSELMLNAMIFLGIVESFHLTDIDDRFDIDCVDLEVDLSDNNLKFVVNL